MQSQEFITGNGLESCRPALHLISNGSGYSICTEGTKSEFLTFAIGQSTGKEDEVFNMSGGEQVRDYLPVETVAEYIVSIALQQK